MAVDSAVKHRWHVHFDRLTDEQHEAIAAPFGSTQLIAGPPGSGRTTVAVYRALALAHVGSKLTRPRPLILTKTLLQARYVTHLLGPFSHAIDVRTAGGWIRESYGRVTGKPIPGGEIDDWMSLAAELSIGGFPMRESVIVDDAHLMESGQLRAIRLLTKSATFTSHYPEIAGTLANGHVVDAVRATGTHMLARQLRQSETTLLTARAWGSPVPMSNFHAARQGNPIRVVKMKPGTAAMEAGRTWNSNRELRVAVVPMIRAHIPSIANLLLQRGLTQSRLFASDMSAAQISKFDIGRGGVYVLEAERLEGLEFDSVIMTSAEAVIGDLSGSSIRRALLAVANSVSGDLSICWAGEDDHVPKVIGVLDPRTYRLKEVT